MIRRLSLRARLVLITMTLLAAGLVASDAVVLVALRTPLIRQVDSNLHTAASMLASVPEETARLLSEANLPGPAETAPRLVDDAYLAYLAPDGTPTLELGNPVKPPLPDTMPHGEWFEVPGWRVITLPAPGGSVVVAGSLDLVDNTVAQVRLWCLLVGAVLLVLLACAGWFWVRGGLRPLRRIEETAAAIAGGDLSQRVPAGAAPNTEVGRLTTSLNGMLTQIETAVSARERSEARMRRFVADASHELRTPLAGIRGFAELYRMGAAEVDSTMDRIERESVRLAGLVDDLLLLAQLDEASLVPSREAMDLRTLAADALHDLRALDPSRPVRLTGPGGGDPGPAPVLGDESRLRQVVSNLVGNVIAHTPAGSAVRIGVGGDDAESVLEISDSGPGLEPVQADNVFERFYRADRSRSRSHGGGAGLGLAIVASLVAAHDGTVDLDTQPGHGATFRIRLPRAR